MKFIIHCRLETMLPEVLPCYYNKIHFKPTFDTSNMFETYFPGRFQKHHCIRPSPLILEEPSCFVHYYILLAYPSENLYIPFKNSISRSYKLYLFHIPGFSWNLIFHFIPNLHEKDVDFFNLFFYFICIGALPACTSV